MTTFAKNLWKLLFGLVLIAGMLKAELVRALGTPRILSVNPPSGSPIGSTVCIRAEVDWDQDFRSMRIKFGNEGWNESAEINFERCFGTDHLSPGWYKIRVEVAKVNEDWGSSTWTEADYELVGQNPEPPPPPDNPPLSQPSRGPSAQVSFDPENYAQAGQDVNIHIIVNSNNPGATKIGVDCGSVSKYETSERVYDSTWRTSGCSIGNINISVCSKAADDPNWVNPTCNWYEYSLSAAQPNNPPPADRNPNDYFHNGDLIKTYSDGRVYVIIKEGSAIQRRWIPNPDSLDALGFSQNQVDNKDFSERELLKLGQGSDIPDVNRDPDRFRTFKATFFPNQPPIVHNQNDPNPSQPNQSVQPVVPGTFDPHAPGVCQGWETRLWVGAYGRVTNQGDQLKLRTGPSLNDNVIIKMPSGSKFTVIGGPKCVDGFTWWNIQGSNRTGWSAEVADKYWWMAPITDPPALKPVQPSVSSPSPAQAPPPTEFETTGENPIVNSGCSELANNQWWNPINPPEVGASEQCTEFVARANNEVEKCWGKGIWPNGGLWDDRARDPAKSGSCGWTVYPSDPSGSVDFSKAVPGDIVVWDPASQNGNNKCKGANFDAGHVAIFHGLNDDGTIRVTESNWSRDHSRVPVDSGCMSLIRTPASVQIHPIQTQISDKCNQYKWPISWLCKWGLIR